MPAAPVHHTAIDSTKAWDGPAEEKAFDKVAGDFVKFYAWVDEGESDKDADGTDKEDGWGPHHDVDSKGIPGDANVKGFQAAMGALNGAQGGSSVIPDGDRQAVWDHLAAHYKDAGIKPADIPELKGATMAGNTRTSIPGSDLSLGTDETPDPVAGTTSDLADALPQAGELADGQCAVCGFQNAAEATKCGACGCQIISGDQSPEEEGVDDENTDAGVTNPTSADENANPGNRSSLKENLVRFRSSGPGAPAILLRDDGTAQSGSTMFGYFSTFNDWYEIDSYWEGTFLERVAPGAYAKTIAEDRSGMRILYDHGFDPQLGNKPLGPIDVLREDGVGAYYEVPLLDTDYNRNFLMPALRGQLMNGQAVGSQLGASFRFIVTGEAWDLSGEVTSFNPQGLPLRTITATKVMEFGPVTFPANDLATSGVRSTCRSTTDALFSRLRSDPLSLARFTERTSSKVVQDILALPPSTMRRSTSNATQPTSDDVQAAACRSFQLRARLALAES